ncbi:Transmembrane protein 50A [Auxenochlorella protothecoides]|uniref:Transmembrane protein 50A n=1 Tax=Auxenochlorella protothecoides TaxID=3075 RepID=A0A087SBV0_AUXPR|nr:Transmembrane protein 50A [Auxenochlorella protothecoides]KFM23204.1 Transmembrane protein 50A [Auxenochlorella protothecoides]RMZ53470.1 hypothetical protein APUTEX25_003292 [Auxenochlorella protothecoides]|eukprot:RMZ53470.1 hypothetical protein APUTEX25_003292 [Auxenochlorella protothecoides]
MAAYTLESAAVRCSDTLSLLVSPEVAEFCRSKSEKYGPGLSGALFGVGVWFWLDAVAISPIKVPFSQARRGSYLPGLVAVLALLMITAVRRDEISYDPFSDDGVYCRSRSWLLAAYLVSSGAVTGSVFVMLHHFGSSAQDTRWVGIASVLEVACILGSALLFFVSRSPGDEGGYDAY